ncbi:MAG: sirohydrochlorin cobaltochelatase [Firmicutes bacterium]|nr:sirohydrochlorin cobaltochelatase [Bacillota bacterium]
MKKTLSKAIVCALSLSMMSACSAAEPQKTSTVTPEEVAALIDDIYVQERTDKTDEQCKAAKEAWDALSDEQKEQVEGEEADPDYFGRDTGDASKDDPGNEDGISENEILVVSFGTSFNDSRVNDINAIEKRIQKEFPDWSVRRAFTAQIIMNHVLARDGERIDNVKEALDRAVANHVKNLVIQPTHLMHGLEYDELFNEVETYTDKFERITFAQPLLGEVGKDASIINEDKKAVAQAISDAALKDSGFKNMAEAKENGVAYVFMGHGTSHNAKVSYSQMSTTMQELGYDNVFIGTVEGEPEETACEEVIKSVKEAGYTKVVLRPLMVVAGDHANNDMAGDDEDSWKSMFAKEFEVDCQIAGLGRIEAVQDIYVEHTKAALAGKDIQGDIEQTNDEQELADGIYTVDFTTDSNMFHANETQDGKAVLTVKDGKMNVHVILAGKGILNLYVGSEEDAKENEAEWLNPVEEKVAYEDGTTDSAYAYDIPVQQLNHSFTVSIIGKKGKWYAHEVTIANPVKVE